MKIILSTLWKNLRNMVNQTPKVASNADIAPKAASQPGLPGGGNNIDRFEEVKPASTVLNPGLSGGEAAWLPPSSDSSLFLRDNSLVVPDNSLVVPNNGLLIPGAASNPRPLGNSENIRPLEEASGEAVSPKAALEDEIHCDIVYDISKLSNTQNFLSKSLAHILEGELNAGNQAVGFHYEGMPNQRGQIIPGTELPPNAHGVYVANVEVDGVVKRNISSFFPKDWTPQQIVDAINEAYDNRQFVRGNTYSGILSSGMEIHMYLDSKNKIISAFPIH